MNRKTQRPRPKNSLIGPLITGLSLIIVLLTLRGIANALPCRIGFVDGNPNGSNDGSYACQNGGVGDNNDKAADLDGYFSLSGWELLQKEDTPGGLTTAVDIGLQVSPDNNAPSGTWEFDPSVWDSYSDIIIVVKDGRTPENIYWSAYQVPSGDTRGDWDTGGRGLSHLTVYGIEGDANVPVPEPATLALFGIGLGGLRLMRKRIRA